MRQAHNDVRGEISELLGKALNRGALDEELTATDKERMIAFLRTYGDLAPDRLFKGSTRSGYVSLPAAGDHMQSGTQRFQEAFVAAQLARDRRWRKRSVRTSSTSNAEPAVIED